MKKPPRKKLVLWAVVCKRHIYPTHYNAVCSYAKEAQATERYWSGDPCGPHKIVRLEEKP